MTLRELLFEIQESYMDYLDCDVIIQEDAEGNTYHKSFTVGLAIDDEQHNYPAVAECNDLSELYGSCDDIPSERVIVIV